MKALLQYFSKVRVVILEIPAFFLFIEAFEIYLQTIQLSLSPFKDHLYWLGILGFGYVYGFPIAVLTATIAGLFTLNWRGIHELYAIHLASELSVPFLFLLEGILVGIFFNRDQSSLAEAQTTTRELTGRIEDLEGDRQRLIDANLALEKKAVSREDTVLTLYESAQKLGSLEVEEIFENIPGLLTDYLHAESCSIYIHENHQLALVAQQNWENDQQYPRIYEHSHPLYKLVQQKKRILTERELEGVDDAILAAPLITQDKRIYGILKIEQISFMNLHPASLQIIQMLSDWTIKAIENAQSFGARKEAQVHDEETGAHTFFYFKERLKREIRLARRYKLDLSILFVSVINFDRMDQDTQQTVLRIVYRVMEFQFRGDDIITRGDDERYQFCLILPFTNQDGAEMAVQRCAGEIFGYEFKPFESEEELLLLAWDVVSTDDQSLFAHPIVLEIIPEDKQDRTEEMIERLLGE